MAVRDTRADPVPAARPCAMKCMLAAGVLLVLGTAAIHDLGRLGRSGEVEVEVRNRILKAEIVKLPFVREGKSMLTNEGKSE